MKSAAQLAGVTSESVLERDWSCIQGLNILHRVPCRLQESVTCGPVCLMMAADALLDGGHGKSLSGLVELAVKRGFSKKGEMFSCAHMAELAREYFEQLESEVVSDWDESNLAKRLKQCNGLALVPYDCASNFEPAMFEGEKAHWAVVVGFDDAASSVVCVQPKSKRVGVWSAKDLVASNRNLQSCKNKQMQNLVVPDDLGELRGKIVILNKETRRSF
jgi:hypothetical protein